MGEAKSWGRRFAVGGGSLVAVAGVMLACSTSSPSFSAGQDAGGVNCGTQSQLCGDSCTVLARDPENCGTCGKKCGAGEVCSAGACATACGPGTKACGQACANTQNDPGNCGACGTKCGAGEVCTGGTCGILCPGSEIKCGSSCVDTATDRANCGACGTACAAGEVCSGGVCGLSCQAGLTMCSASVADGGVADASADAAADGGTLGDPYCANVQTDNANCGACGVTCPQGKVCSAGACSTSCQPNQTQCAGDGGVPYCADTQNDPSNCGTCGNPCAAGYACSKGACVQLGCGTDCWGAQGCLTAGGHCIQFSCRAGNASAGFCNACKGWSEVTYNDWLNGGWCSDVIARYRTSNGSETKCGAAATCCGTSAACAGSDNAWHFYDGVNNRYTGPILGNANDTNCTAWNGTDNSAYTRITACKRY